MKRLSKKELEAAQRIFNHIDYLSGGYHGRKTLDEAKNFVSQNRWIMYPVHNIHSLKEGSGFPTPNIFVSSDTDEIVDDGSGRIISGSIGVTYNNVESMLWFNDILKNKSEFLMSSIQFLSAGWNVYISQKIKTNYKDNTPIYRTVKEFDNKHVTIDEINGALSMSNDNLLGIDDDYQGEPVLWCVSVMSVETVVTSDTFDNDISEALALFHKLLSIR